MPKPKLILKGIPEDADRETLELVAEYKRRLDENPLLRFRPEPKQKEFLSATTRVKALIAANKIGKTTVLVIDMLIQALPIELVPEHLRPYKVWGNPGQIPFKGRILSPGLTRTMDAAILDRVREWCPSAGFETGDFKHSFDKQSRVLRFAGGGWIDFFSYEQDLQAHSGVDLHRVGYDEEPPGDRGKAIREESRTRLVYYAGDEAFALTPLLGYSYIKEAIADRADDPEVTVIHATMFDAAHLDRKEIEAFMHELTDEQIQARVKGEFVHFGGLVYREWDPDRHLVKPPTKEHVRKLDTYIGIDPGVRTTAVVFCGFDKENSMLIYDELYLHDQYAIPENAAQAIRARLVHWGTKEHPLEPRYVLIDPSARNRDMVAAEGVQAAFMRSGIMALEGQPDREAGVFEIKRRMQATDPQLLYVSEDCPMWKWECEKYRMKEKPDGSFDTIKEDDHTLDASRYVAMARPLPLIGRPQDSRQRRNSWTPGTAPPFNGYGPSRNVPPLGSLS